jgi:hypothetical protein
MSADLRATPRDEGWLAWVVAAQPARSRVALRRTEAARFFMAGS